MSTTAPASPAHAAPLDPSATYRGEQRARFRRGQRAAIAGSVALPAGTTVAYAMLPQVALFGGDEPAYVAPMLFGGLTLMAASVPLQLTGTWMQRSALENVGCEPRPDTMRYAAPAMFVGAGAGAAIEWWSIMPEIVPWIAAGGWAAATLETTLLTTQAARCAGMRPPEALPAAP